MRDKKVESDIVDLKEFIQLWVAFGDFLKQGGENLGAEKEQAFMESKSLLARKYESISGILESQYSTDNKVSSILSKSVSLNNISFLLTKGIPKCFPNNNEDKPVQSINRSPSISPCCLVDTDAISPSSAELIFTT